MRAEERGGAMPTATSAIERSNDRRDIQNTHVVARKRRHARLPRAVTKCSTSLTDITIDRSTSTPSAQRTVFCSTPYRLRRVLAAAAIPTPLPVPLHTLRHRLDFRPPLPIPPPGGKTVFLMVMDRSKFEILRPVVGGEIDEAGGRTDREGFGRFATPIACR